jgi:DNA mismatch repair protein MutS
MTSDLTPLRKQYLDVKRRYPNEIVFFRLGDFYETFDGDAELAARELDLVLTSRPVSKGQRIPMAGIPYHAVEGYLARLIAKGYHVAICDQVGEEPAKGLFAREVTRVVTPGTVVEPGLLDDGRNNYLAALVLEPGPASTPAGRAGLAYADITTGEFAACQFQSADAAQLARQELARLRPAELLVIEGVELPLAAGINRSPLPAWKFEVDRARRRLLEHFGVASLAGFGLEGQPLATSAAGAILHYLGEHQPGALNLLTALRSYGLGEFMLLDAPTRRNLELMETIRSGQAQGSLLGVLDYTVTPMGARQLRQWVSQPLLDLGRIQERLDQVEALYGDGLLRAELRAVLRPLADLERLTNRALGGTATPRDLAAIRSTVEALPALQKLAGHSVETGPSEAPDTQPRHPSVHPLLRQLDVCADVCSLLQGALDDDPPHTLGRRGVIRPGYSAELDGVNDAARGAREWIAGLEKAERERTGIKSLKVGYNKVFGYYIELTKATTTQAPPGYIRKQTLVNAERYLTPELKEYETLVLNADERVIEIETRLFKELCAQVTAAASRLLTTARALARLDALAGLAEAAARNNYVRPVLVTDPVVLEIRQGRHPVVELSFEGERFVPNDIVFEPGECIRIITGPNMSGKSTTIRMTALIVLMAQMGSYVPAASARLGVVDRIFTRIGAQDEIHAGHSTFMVEMTEAAGILHHATARSLLILDEIGRGTSTYDGLSLAWAIIEHLHNHPRLKPKTLFATHYHELTELARQLPGVRNYNVAVAEEGDRVVFLHQIVPGGADRSYGIHVAQLAGMPRPVINRAQEILRDLEKSAGRAAHADEAGARQMALFPEVNPLLQELEGLDLASLTPLEALNRLYEWQRRYLGTATNGR